jgi:hypothetical protein
MDLRAELDSRIVSIGDRIEELKRQAKDSVGNPASIDSINQQLRALNVRLQELERNRREIDP